MPKTDHRVNLTKTMVDALPLAAAGERYQKMDAQVPGFGVRVSEKTKTFILRTRYPGDTSASRRELGRVGVMTLADAREKARKWRTLIGDGKDPAKVEAEKRAAEIRKQKLTFGAVVDDFIAEKVKSERNAHDVKTEIDRDLRPTWGNKPIAEISDVDVSSVVKAKAKTRFDKKAGRTRGGQVAAKNLFSLVKRFFRWAAAQPEYGLSGSPCTNLSAATLIGESSNSRDRILDDHELCAFWTATGRMASPVKHAYRMLLLTALRKREVTDATRDEFDREKLEWTIGAARMKGTDRGKRQSSAHLVPLIPAMVEILDDLPKVKGPHIFTTGHGDKPVYLGSKPKRELDRLMLEVLREMAVDRGEDASKVNLKDFTTHDLRRTARSRFSRLGVSDAVAESILAHRRPGIVGIYDHHTYADEKRAALERWAAHVRDLVEPPPGNVVTMKRRELQ